MTYAMTILHEASTSVEFAENAYRCLPVILKKYKQTAVTNVLKLKINFILIISTFVYIIRHNHEKMMKNYNNICYSNDKNSRLKTSAKLHFYQA